MLRSISFCFAILFVHHVALAQAKAPPAAEQVARAYMSAFYTGDFQTAANLADPVTIDKVHDIFLAELAKVEGTEQEKGFLAHHGIARPLAEVKAMTPKALYVTLAAGRQLNGPKTVEAMRATLVEVESSEMTPGGGAIVHLRITMPAGQAPSSQVNGLSLRLVASEWKVVANAD
jgi:hypothetical protein